MSRIGKQPITIPNGVSVKMDDRVFIAKSSKGELKVPVPQDIAVEIDGSTITVKPEKDDVKLSAFWGLTRALVNNAVVGLDQGWEKILEIRGVGYRANLKGKTLDLQIGQSHPIEITPPAGITFEVTQESIDGANAQVVKVSGFDKQLVGDVSATIRALKPPEPYKGKGIRYRGEYVRRKAGKATG